MHAGRWLLTGCAVLVGACAGNGEGLDENGRPLDDPAAPLTAEFASLQARVFTPYCTGCHAGAAAPLGLNLAEGAAYAALVNAPSVEQPALRRVLPGNPDASYLVQKVSGTAAVGARMPLGGPPLPQEAIDAIRQWIRDGAAPPRGVAPSATPSAGTQLGDVFPVDASRVDFADAGMPSGMTGPIVVTATTELDTTTLTSSAISLVRSGGDGSFWEGNEVTMKPLRVDVRSLEPTVFAIAAQGAWAPDTYRLVISGSGASPVLDRQARIIDGDFDSLPGGDYVMHFEVAATGAIR